MADRYPRLCTAVQYWLVVTVQLCTYPLSWLVYLDCSPPGVYVLLNVSLLVGCIYSITLTTQPAGIDPNFVQTTNELIDITLCVVAYTLAVSLGLLLLYLPLGLAEYRPQVSSALVCVVTAVCFLSTCTRIHKESGAEVALVESNGYVASLMLVLLTTSVAHPGLSFTSAARLLLLTLAGTFAVTLVYKTCFPRTSTNALKVSCLVLIGVFATAAYASMQLVGGLRRVLAVVCISCLLTGHLLATFLYTTPTSSTATFHGDAVEEKVLAMRVVQHRNGG